ncbi:MAG: hypothetical protein R6U84_02060 [Candidatus Cloacimonadales bacterium]
MSPMPTLTLAKLFEQQEQYVEALALYHLLFTKFQDNKLLEKIAELKNQIFSNNEAEYHKFLTSLFQAEERENLQILPHQQFKDYQATIEQFKEQKKSKPKTNKNTHNSSQPELSDILKQLDEIAPEKLSEKAESKFQKQVSELTIAELKQLVQQ